MNLNTLLRVVLRHRIVVSAVIVITISTAWGFWVSVLPTYKTEATVWVIPPSRAADGTDVNPLEGIAAKANDLVARALALSVNSPEWRRPLVEQGYSGDYIIDDGDGDSPFLGVIVEAEDRELALATRDALVEALNSELTQTQDALDVSVEDRIVLDTVTLDPARVEYGSRDRLVASTVLLGLLAAVAFALLLDAFERSRDQPTSGRRGSDGPPDSADGVPDRLGASAPLRV
jgi:hypothetical protein